MGSILAGGEVDVEPAALFEGPACKIFLCVKEVIKKALRIRTLVVKQSTYFVSLYTQANGKLLGGFI